MLDLVRLAATDTRTHGQAYRYGLSSFATVLSDPDFYGMLVVTLVFVAASVALQLGLGLRLAVLIDAARRRGRARHAVRAGGGGERVGDPRACWSACCGGSC